MPKAKKIKAIKKETKKISLSLDLGDVHHETTGDTITEAIDKFENKIDRFKLRTFGIFTLRMAGKKSEYRATPFQIRRMLINKTFKEILADKLVGGLK